jgi:hypothetical protein
MRLKSNEQGDTTHSVPKQDSRIPCSFDKRIQRKLDITKAFHQIEIDKALRNEATITTHEGLFRYKRLHMCISNAQEEFTEAIRCMLYDFPEQINMTDDILVHGTTETHGKRLIEVLRRLEEAGVTLNIDKCEFFKSSFYCTWNLARERPVYSPQKCI